MTTTRSLVGQRVVAQRAWLNGQHGTIVDTISNGIHKGDVIVHWDHDGSRTIHRPDDLHLELP